MDQALVIGADSRLGEGLCRRLLKIGFRVFALGRDFSASGIDDKSFIKLEIDLADFSAVHDAIGKIPEAGACLSVVAFTSNYLPQQTEFNRIAPEELELFLKLHTALPLFVARLCIEDLNQTHGNLLYVCPSQAVEDSQPVLSLATLSPLKAAFEALQRQNHDSGLRITMLHTEFFVTESDSSEQSAEADVKQHIDSQNRIDPEAVADVLEQLVIGREGNFATEIYLRPRTPKGPAPLARTVLKPGSYSSVQLPPPDKTRREPELIPTLKPQRKNSTPSDEPVTYTSLSSP